MLLRLPFQLQPFNEIGWVIFCRLRPFHQAPFRYSAFRFMQWPARSLIAPAPSHRHKTSIASISIAISIRGLGARVGTGRGQGFAFVGAAPSPFPDPCPRPLPSPCASHRPPIAISPPSQGETIKGLIAERAIPSRSPLGCAFAIALSATALQ